jgi:hypothetical protein
MTSIITTNGIKQIEYKIAIVHAANGKMEIYFQSTEKIGDEIIRVSQETTPLILPLDPAEELDQLWQQIEEVILTNKRAALNGDEIKTPDYKKFYEALIVSTIFQRCREFAANDTKANLAYTEFAIALIQEKVNVQALQVCLDNMLKFFPIDFEFSELKGLLENHAIPIGISVITD